MADAIARDTPTPGSAGLGDSLYPNLGNGGYDVQKYDINLDISDVLTSTLVGVTTLEAAATQALSSFNLDFIGFDIISITVNGEPAAFSREGQDSSLPRKHPWRKERHSRQPLLIAAHLSKLPQLHFQCSSVG